MNLYKKVKLLPEKPWVYLFKTKSWKILYVGKAKNLKKRVSQYFQKDIWVWKEEMLSRAEDIDFIITKSEEESLLLENNLIKKYQPPFNSLLKWDTGYIYIRIWWSNNCEKCKNFPKIEFTRYKDKPWIYIWPKPWKKNLKKTLQILRQILKFRTCSDTQFKKWKICSDFIFWLCKWWCLTVNQTEKHKLEYKRVTDLIIDFFKWEIKPAKNIILTQIEEAIKKENFERAAKLRDIYYFLDKISEEQSVVLEEDINWYYFLIKQIENFIIFVITYFHNWKLIDIIKYKEKWITLEEALQTIKTEFWNNIKFEKISNKMIFGYQWILKNKEDILKFLSDQIDTIIIASSFEKENILNEILKNIQIKLKLKNFPYKIEWLDISHLSWWRTSWWLVKMIWWIMYKRWYRKYKIKTPIEKWDDLASLKEVLTRRFKLNDNLSIENLDLPDLFIIDGWENQIWILKDLIKEYPKFSKILDKVDFISIEKWKSRSRKWKIQWEKENIYIFKNNQIIKYSSEILSDEELKILTRVRDEAHRFANIYRIEQMKKEFK